MSAESNIVRPASRQISTSRVASVTSLAPQALNSSPRPPNVPVPRLSTGTLKPEPPRSRYSIIAPFLPYGTRISFSTADFTSPRPCARSGQPLLELHHRQREGRDAHAPEHHRVQ